VDKSLLKPRTKSTLRRKQRCVGAHIFIESEERKSGQNGVSQRKEVRKVMKLTIEGNKDEWSLILRGARAVPSFSLIRGT